MSKRNILVKAWPEVVGYIPALVPYSSLNTKKNIGRNFMLDLDNCLRVDSSGLNIFLIQLLQLSNRLGDSREWEFVPKQITDTINIIKSLGFFNKLNSYSDGEKKLFSIQNFDTIQDHPVIQEINSGEILKSYPIFSIKIPDQEQSNRRAIILKTVREWCHNKLFDYERKYMFNLMNLIDVVTEIAKNTADHTESDLFLGLDIEEDKDEEYVRIRFSAGDVGEGLNAKIRKAVESSEWKENVIEKQRLKYWDLTQTYRWGCQSGNTTKFSSVHNKGIGMASIMDCSRKTPMELSVFDATSRGLLSNLDPFNLSHAKVRKEFSSIGKAVGFYYYGLVSAKRR